MLSLHTHLPQQAVPAALELIWTDTRQLGFLQASESLGCALLRVLAASKTSGRFLELGTGTGLSTAWLLDGMDQQSSLLSMDNDSALLAVAQRHLGDDPRLKLVCQDGQSFIRSLKGQQFDFIFADTWAGKYQLFDETVALIAPGGLYVIDDMLRQSNWPEGHAEKVDHLLAVLCSTPFLKIVSLNWATGIVVATRVTP